MIHPFEKAGLGKAPFRCVGMYEKVFKIPGEPPRAGGTCDYCANGIRYVYQVVGADKREFGVGCDCVAKVDKVLVKQARAARRTFAREKVEQTRRVSAKEKRAKIRQERGAALAPMRDLLIACYRERAIVYFRHAVKNALKFGSLPGWKVEQIEIELTKLAANRVEEARKKASKWIGQPGERLEAVLTCVAKIHGGDWNRWTLSILHDANGNTLTTFGACDLWKGDTARCKFTVKQHQERDGEKQTMILRIKVME